MIKDLVLKGSRSQGFFIIPTQPPRAPPPFLIYLLEQQEYVKKKLDQKLSQKDLIKLLKQEWEILEDKQIYFNRYEKLNSLAQQQRENYKNIFDSNSYRNSHLSAQLHRIVMSQNKIKNYENEKVSIEESRERFRLQQQIVFDQVKQASQYTIDIANQISHLMKLRQLQIRAQCLHYYIPKYLNSQIGISLCEQYSKTYKNQENPEITFKNFLIQNGPIKKIDKFEKQLKNLAQLLQYNEDQLLNNIAYLIANPKKQTELKRKKKVGKKSNDTKFYELLDELLE